MVLNLDTYLNLLTQHLIRFEGYSIHSLPEWLLTQGQFYLHFKNYFLYLPLVIACSC